LFSCYFNGFASTCIQISAIPKEIADLWVAYNLAGQKITDSSQRSSVMAEIKTLLDGYARKKKRLAKACTSNLQMQQKKFKKEELELHKGQESLQQDQQNQVREQEHQQNNSQQKDQKQESQMRENEQQQPINRPQEVRVQQQHLNGPRPCTRKLPTLVAPMVLNVAGHPPYSAVPGVRGAPIFALPPGAAQYIGPFNPFYPHSQFFPR
jgi:Skp family chaperone for outer membrane proteins